MLLFDSFLNEYCFKGSSMGLKVHTNSKNNSQVLRKLRNHDSPMLRTPGSWDSMVLRTILGRLPSVPSTGESFKNPITP